MPDDEKKKPAIPSANYEMVTHGAELPPEPDAEPRDTRPQLTANLIAIQQQPEEWVTVATYNSPGGAARILKLLKSGEQPIPEGAVYEIEKRRVAGGGSSLVAKYVVE